MAARYSRIVVIGISGAGKSTLARRLATALRLPLVELDRQHWRPGWQSPPREEWRGRVAELVAAERWVMDGNYAGSLDIRLPRADTVVWLDYPHTRALRRVFVRVWRDHGRTRPGMAEGCPERLDLDFLRYVWTFPARVAPRLEQAIAQFANHAKLYRIRQDAEWPALIAEMSAP